MTSSPKEMSRSHKAVFLSVLVLVVAWVWVNFPRLAAGQNGVLSFTLGTLFALLLIFREKHEGEGFKLSGLALVVAGMSGALLAAAGVIIPVHQLEWLGVLLVLYAALAWALPRRHGKDFLIALCLLYWIHPLPSQVFGPIQLSMQWLSVKFSEMLLHMVNVHVWADEFVLRTGARVFGVPEACSGMKTAVTVVFCAVGVGLLLRLRWGAMTVLISLGMLQVLVLNVIRISAIVWMGKDQPIGWDIKTLHDTMGVFLLLAVGWVHLDAVLIRQWVVARDRLKQLDSVNDMVGEDIEKIQRWPAFWVFFYTWLRPIAVVLLVAGTIAVLVWRLTPHHRMEMIRGVVQGLLVTDLENAERAVQAALVLEPGNEDLMTDLTRIKLGRGRYEEALKIIRRRTVSERSLADRVLEARALLLLKRIDDVKQVVALFPPGSRDLPGVAMVLAEFNATLDKAEEVAKYVVKAARGIGTQEGVRNLFPYMASRDLWESIRKSDSSLPYAYPIQGVIAAESRLRVNDIAGAADVLRRAMKGRENDPVFINPVIRVAREWPTAEWLGRFESLFLASMDRLKPSDLTLAMDGGFSVGRADLGWMAYTRLKASAPDDPMLLIAPAEYGRKWFRFQRDMMGTSVPGQELVEMKPFFKLARGLSPWRELWEQIPLVDELGGMVSREAFQKRLRLCLGALEKMEARKKLDVRLQLLWGRVLGELGRWDEAHAKLGQFETKAPRRRRDFLLAHAELYKMQGDWEACYETMGEYVRTDGHPPLTAWLDLANAAMAMDLGAYALGCMEEARRDYPQSEEWSLAMAGILDFFGFGEESLFIVNAMAHAPHPAVRAKLLMETGRVVEGRRLASVEKLEAVVEPKVQAELLAPAEWVLEWRGGQLAQGGYEREKAALKEHRSPFLKSLKGLKSAWYDAKGQGATSDPLAWEAAGRDVREKAMALNELTVLLMRQGRTNEAARVAEQAVEKMPNWSPLWRLALAVTGGREAPGGRPVLRSEGNLREGASLLSHMPGASSAPVQPSSLIDRAVAACPTSSEIWLASLVMKARAGVPAASVDREVDRVIAERWCSPGTLVRAGQFLLRENYTNAACAAARAAIKDGQGLLAAHVLGVMCGLKVRDVTWVLACARAGADQALEPWPFYKIMIGLKLRAGAKSGKMDPDVIRALEGLAARYPEQPIWATQLGELYFRKGQTERALGVLEDALAREEGQKQAKAKTYLLAAEAARQEGDWPRAIKILKQCRDRYPKDVIVLNNLLFTLAQEPAGVQEAVALLPRLLEANRDDFAFHDTVALVYTRAGNLKEAERYMRKALKAVKTGDYASLEVYLDAAEMLIRIGDLKEARRNLDVVIKTSSRSAAVDVRARELLGELTKKEQDQTSWF